MTSDLCGLSSVCRSILFHLNLHTLPSSVWRVSVTCLISSCSASSEGRCMMADRPSSGRGVWGSRWPWPSEPGLALTSYPGSLWAEGRPGRERERRYPGWSEPVVIKLVMLFGAWLCKQVAVSVSKNPAVWTESVLGPDHWCMTLQSKNNFLWTEGSETETQTSCSPAVKPTHELIFVWVQILDLIKTESEINITFRNSYKYISKVHFLFICPLV